MFAKLLLLAFVASSVVLADDAINRSADSTHGCMRNEVWKDCGSPCEDVCGKTKDPNCGTQCVPACQCRDGYSRSTGDPRATCVPVEQCGKCGAHERVSCELSCDNVNQHPHICPAFQCGPRAPCMCTDGYVRDSTTGECILRENCLAKKA